MWVSHIRALIKLQFISPIEMIFNPHPLTVITALCFVASSSLTFRVLQEHLISHFLISPLFSIYVERMMLKLRFSSQKEVRSANTGVLSTDRAILHCQWAAPITKPGSTSQFHNPGDSLCFSPGKCRHK